MNNIVIISSIVLCLLGMQSCKDDVVPTTKNPTNCKLTSVDIDAEKWLEFKYNGNRISEFIEGGYSVHYVYTNDQISSLIWNSSSKSDTVYQSYNNQGQLESRVQYFGGELDDSISFTWNGDGTLKSMQSHGSMDEEFIGWLRWQMSVTYQNGDATTLRFVQEDNLVQGLDTLNDEYVKIELEVNDQVNPFYGFYKYQWHLSDLASLYEFFTRGFTKHHMVKAAIYEQGDLDDVVSFSYKHNQDNLLVQFTEVYLDGETYVNDLHYKCD